MSTIQVAITAPLDAFVEEQVRSGAYPDADAVVRMALRRLQRSSRHGVKEARFHAMLDEARQESERGEGVPVQDLDLFFAEIAADVDREDA